MGVARTYAVYIVWPVSAVIGVIGYNFEKIVRGNKQTPWQQSISHQREERLSEETTGTDCTNVTSLKEQKKGLQKTIFDKNKL